MIEYILCKKKRLKSQPDISSQPKPSRPAQIRNPAKSDVSVPSPPRPKTPKRLFKPSHNRKRKAKAMSKKKSNKPAAPLSPKEDALSSNLFYPTTTIRPLRENLNESAIEKSEE